MEKKKRGRPRKEVTSGFAPKPDPKENSNAVLEQIITKQNEHIVEQHKELIRMQKDVECIDQLLIKKTQDHNHTLDQIVRLNNKMSELCITANEQALKNSRQEQIISKLFEVINLINKKPE